ncbi:MAG: DUF401 family protein [Proteobacteria bacterium]|nr:DUF401 family protein [Pseudomonadota bacterium]
MTLLPAGVKLGLAFALILLLNRVKLHLGACLLLGAAALGFMMELPPEKVLLGIVYGIIEPQSLSLVVIVAVILVLSRLMGDAGQLDRIVSSFSSVVHSVKLTTVVMPALIGLLPMPGGALFSAPMVETAGKDANLKPEMKTAINYWFRHLWEYWWPMYPGVVLAVSLLGLEAWRFMLVQFPLTLVSLASGIFFLIRPLSLPKTGHPENPVPAGHWGDFLREVRPILAIVLAIPLVGLINLVPGANLPPLTSVFLGLGLCLVWVVRINRIPPRQIFRAAFNRSVPPMILLIIGIMAFKALLVESQAVSALQAEMARYGIPPLLVIMLMPMLTGFITGIAVGFVGASFPLVVPLIAGKTGFDFLSHASLAYAFGYMGMMLSPVHLCLLVSKDYYQASLLKSYRHLLGPAATVLAVVLVLFGITRLFY